ncbi:MAG: sugar ABC transporter permease [Oscillospiraceae bacterium]|nr:sugar ABC transporter permease [Oscillospiraceae bacterium]
MSTNKDKTEKNERTLRERWHGLNYKTKDFIQSWMFSGPSVLGVSVFFILPFLVVVYYSVIKSPLNPEFVFLENFQNVIGNQAFKIAVKNTADFSIVAVPLAVILSLGLALMLEARIPLKSQFRTFFLSPMMVPVASVVLIWQVLFDRNGVLNEIMLTFGLDKIDWLKSEWAIGVIVVLYLWKNLGYNMILFMAALSNIPRELLEVADVEGASETYKFFSIKLRYLSPTVLFVTILSMINSFKVFREIYLLTGEYPVERLYMLQHFMNNTFEALDYQKLSAAAVILAIAMVIIIALLFKVEDSFGKDVEG